MHQQELPKEETGKELDETPCKKICISFIQDIYCMVYIG